MEIESLLPQAKRYDMNPQVRLIKRFTDIMNMPMRDIKCSVEALKPFQQYKINRILASSYTFNTAMLPKDICLYILQKAYGEPKQDESRKVSFFCTPMLKAIILHKNLCDDPITIKGRSIVLSSYLMLSEKGRELLRSAANPSLASKYIEGKSDSVLSQEEYQVVLQVLPDGIDRGQLIQLPSWWDRVKMGFCGNYDCLDGNGAGVLYPGLILGQSCLLIGALSNHPIATPILYAGGILFDGIVLFVGIHQAVWHCRDHVVAQAHNNGRV